MIILDLLYIVFHAVVVFILGKNYLFQSILGRCGVLDSFLMEPLFQDQCVSLHTTAQYGGHDYDDCHSPCHFTTIKMVVNVADFIHWHAHIVHTSTSVAAARVKKKIASR